MILFFSHDNAVYYFLTLQQLLAGDGYQLVLQSPTLFLPYQFKGECKRTHTAVWKQKEQDVVPNGMVWSVLWTCSNWLSAVMNK